MSRPERQQNVLDLLKGLRGLEPLKKLFWSELNYQRINQPLSRRGWTESANKALTDDPVLFAGGGEDNAFHVIYNRLASDGLPRGLERPVVNQLLREHPYALFVFSNKGQTDWHFLNVKFDEQAEKRRLFRRITVRAKEGQRTASERLAMLDLASFEQDIPSGRRRRVSSNYSCSTRRGWSHQRTSRKFLAQSNAVRSWPASHCRRTTMRWSCGCCVSSPKK